MSNFRIGVKNKMANYVNVYTYKTDVNFKNNLWIDNDGFPITGVKKTYTCGAYGKLQDETMIVDGVNHGVQKVYDQTGQLWYENIWKNGNMVGFKCFK